MKWPLSASWFPIKTGAWRFSKPHSCQEDKLFEVAFQFQNIILILLFVISHTKIPQKRCEPVCVVSLMQIGAGLFVLLVESSSVSRLLKLIYLQPKIFCVDSGNLETRRRRKKTFFFLTFVSWNMQVVTEKCIQKWETCFSLEDLLLMMKAASTM